MCLFIWTPISSNFQGTKILGFKFIRTVKQFIYIIKNTYHPNNTSDIYEKRANARWHLILLKPNARRHLFLPWLYMVHESFVNEFILLWCYHWNICHRSHIYVVNKSHILPIDSRWLNIVPDSLYKCCCKRVNWHLSLKNIYQYHFITSNDAAQMQLYLQCEQDFLPSEYLFFFSY